MEPDRARLLRSGTLLLLAALTAAGWAGCGRRSGPRPIAFGTLCVTCGMEVRDLRFACERERRGVYRVYDSIECLIRDTVVAGGTIYLADYDTQTLQSAETLWIVNGRFPTPMDGGVAAFASRAAAERVASRTEGTVEPWDRVSAGRTGP